MGFLHHRWLDVTLGHCRCCCSHENQAVGVSNRLVCIRTEPTSLEHSFVLSRKVQVWEETGRRARTEEGVAVTDLKWVWRGGGQTRWPAQPRERRRRAHIGAPWCGSLSNQGDAGFAGTSLASHHPRSNGTCGALCSSPSGWLNPAAGFHQGQALSWSHITRFSFSVSEEGWDSPAEVGSLLGGHT